MTTEPEKTRLLADALRGVMSLIDDQLLVRNIDDDHDIMKFTKQAMRLTATLVAANEALAMAGAGDK